MGEPGPDRVASSKAQYIFWLIFVLKQLRSASKAKVTSRNSGQGKNQTGRGLCWEWDVPVLCSSTVIFLGHLCPRHRATENPQAKEKVREA